MQLREIVRIASLYLRMSFISQNVEFLVILTGPPPPPMAETSLKKNMFLFLCYCIYHITHSKCSLISYCKMFTELVIVFTEYKVDLWQKLEWEYEIDPV